MSLSKPELQKIPDIRIWRVYPRVHYFQRRYHELLPRFNRVVKAFPKGFHNEHEQKEIEEIDEMFGNALKMIVFGSVRLELKDIVVTVKPLEEKRFDLSATPKTTLFISHICIDRAGKSELEEIKENIDFLEEQVKGKYPDWLESYFVVIDTPTTIYEREVDSLHSLDEIEKIYIRQEICEYLSAKQTKNIWKHEDRIVFGSTEVALSSVISEYLEAKLIDGFYKVKDYLERFVRVNRGRVNGDIDILHSELVVKAIQTLLRDENGIADLRQLAESDESAETKGWTLDEKILHHLLKKLAILIKCAVVEPCSAMYNLPTWIVNLLLVELNFETKVVESMSKNTRYHLRKRLKSKGDVRLIGLMNYKFDFIIYPIQNDASKVISDAEKTMASASRIVTVMEKMIFEVEGYLEQTIVRRLKYEPKTPVPAIPKGLRQEILQHENVYGVGIIYDTLEVHLKSEKDQPNVDAKTKEDSTKSGTEVAAESIPDTISEEISAKKHEYKTFDEEKLKYLLKKYGYSLPYKVRKIAHEVVKMMADIQHENGKLIKSPLPNNMLVFRSGTLGAFVIGEDGNLYALTCGHVVCNPDKEEHDVFIQEWGSTLKKIGVSIRNMTLCPGEGPCSVIDFAAVRIVPDMVCHCIRRLKDDSGLNRKGKVADESVIALRKRNVYKYGALSGLTRGIICSSDFGLSDIHVEEDMYILLIEALPGDVTTIFAKKGDSGAVICMPDPNSDDVKVVAMLSGGDYKEAPEASPKYFSFLLKTGLQKMKDVSNMDLEIP